jgi:predicted Abi (CAAX) family protease
VDRGTRRAWRQQDPAQAERLEALVRLDRSLRRALLPFGGQRNDWRRQEGRLGTSLEDQPLDTVLRALGSWRTALPRLASDTVVRVFLAHGASALVLRSNQVGGEHPEIEPVAPVTLW